MRQLIGWTGSPRGRGIFAGIITVAVIVMVAGIYHVFAPGQSGLHAIGTPTATFAALPGPRGQWVTVNGMAGGVPAITPSDPRVVYEVFNELPTSSGPPIFKRSSDGGTTWQELPIPGGQVQPGTSTGMGTYATVIPSSTDPNLVFLTVGVPYPRNCPTWPKNASYQTNAMGAGTSAATLSAKIHASGYIQCNYEYRSADGGHTWQQITLPAGGQLFPSPFVRPVGGSLTLYAQGNRLYSVDEGDHDELHLIRSDDGGVTWMVIDLPQAELTASGQTFVDYMPAHAGSTVFATTDDMGGLNLTVWRSDDAGASWHQVIGSVPGDRYHGMQVVDRAGNTLPLIYIAVSVQDGSSPTGDSAQFDVSTDGGATWAAAPTNGLLPLSQMEPSLQGTLADGSIIVEGPPPSPSGPSALTFYAWKAGQSAWRQAAPGVVSGWLLAITALDASGHQALWVITDDDSQVQRCVLE